MTEKKQKKSAKKSATMKKPAKPKPDLVVAQSDDLREVVTETVTKLLAEDVLEMDEDGVIDVKRPDRKKKKAE
ncbi:hypothetical protein [[Eubacterium] cellulosolvens]